MANINNMNELYQTKDLVSVINQCEFTQTQKFMTGLIADTGMGKSTSLKYYSANHDNVFLVTVDKTMNAKRLYTKILEALGVKFDGNIHDVMLKIAEELNSLENPLLIIDEAGKMNHVMMLYMHDLREYTRDNCGILLAGMPYFKKNLQKFADKQKEGCSEFLRRINIWHELQGLSLSETKFICNEHGIADNIKDYKGLRFGDLMNKILLEQLTNQTA